MSKKTKLWSGLTAIAASALCVVCVGNSVANANAYVVNEFLNVQLSKIEHGEVDPNEDTIYYKSSFGDFNAQNLEKLKAAGKAQNINEMREGAVLLYNQDGVLPLKSAQKISLFGRASAQPVYQGRAAGEKVTNNTELKIDLKDALKEEGFEVNPTIWDSLAAQATNTDGNTGGKATGSGTGELDKAFYEQAISDVGNYSDAAIVTLSRIGAEGTDLSMAELDDDGTTTISSLALHQNEREMLELVRSKFNKVVVLLNSPNQMEVEEIKEYCDAILFIGTPGTYGFQGVAEILSGTTNPSGHLVDTYAVNSLSAPACVNSGTQTPYFSNYQAIHTALNDSEDTECTERISFQAESIYIGYRYYETRYYDSVANPSSNASDGVGASNGATSWKYSDEVSYTFGHGLSYTTFEQTLDKVTVEEDAITVEVTVQNTGSVTGKSVVQVYVQTPYGDYEKQNKVEKSAIEIAGFAKTKELAAGASETVTVTIDKYLLASYDYTNAKSYYLSGGDYYFAIGDDAHDAVNNVLAYQNKNVSDGMTSAGDADKVISANMNRDTEKYKYSDAGVRVTNQFDDCDLNNWVSGAGTYLSRSNWKSTYPVTQTTVTATNEMIKILGGDTYETPENAPSYESVASQFGTNADLTLVMMKDVPYEDTVTWRQFVLQASLDEIVTATGEAFTCLAVGSLSPSFGVGDGCDAIETGFSGGVIYIYKQSGTTKPLTDENGNSIDEVDITYRTVRYCSKSILTGTFNVELYEGRGKMLGEEGLWANCMEIYNTGADLHRTPFGGRSFEYMSECPTMSYLASIPEVAATEATGSHAAPKHFVGNDQETYRTGVACFFNEQAFRQGSLRAFEGAIKVSKAGGLMQSFERLGLNWASASYALNTTVLRNEWGWTGNVVTDAAPMRDTNMSGYKLHALSTFAAGSQQYCFDANGYHAKAAIEWAKENNDGYILECIIQSAIDWEYAIANSVVINGMSSSDKIVSVTPWWQTAFIAVISGLAVLTAAGAAALVFSKVKEDK